MALLTRLLTFLFAAVTAAGCADGVCDEIVARLAECADEGDGEGDAQFDVATCEEDIGPIARAPIRDCLRARSCASVRAASDPLTLCGPGPTDPDEAPVAEAPTTGAP